MHDNRFGNISDLLRLYALLAYFVCGELWPLMSLGSGFAPLFGDGCMSEHFVR